MKKFWLTLGLTLMLVCCCGVGYYGFGTSSAFGQPYYSQGLSCDPNDPNCYNDDLPPVVVPSFKLGWGLSQARDPGGA